MSKTATAETLIEDTPPPAPSAVPILNAARFGQPGQFHADWCATVPSDTPWEAIHSPRFWRVVVHRMRIGDLIEVRSDNLTKWGLFLVTFVEVSTGAINLAPIHEREFEAAQFTPDATAAYYPSYQGVVNGWCVKRAEDDKVMVANLRSQQEARSRIASDYSNPVKPIFG
jgi:hypothetical protein